MFILDNIVDFFFDLFAKLTIWDYLALAFMVWVLSNPLEHGGELLLGMGWLINLFIG